MASIYAKLNAEKEDAAQSEKYTELLYKLTNLNELTEVFYTEGEDGEYPKVDELSLKAIRNSYKAVIDVCDEISSGVGGKLSDNIKDITGELKNLLMQDYAALNAVKGDDQKSLGEIITEGRSLEFDAGDQKLGFDAGSLNKRIPLKIKGTGKEGYFTPTTNVDFEGRKKKIFDTASSKHPELKPLFDKMKMLDKKSLSELSSLNLSSLITRCKLRTDYKKPLKTPEEKKAGAEYVLKSILKDKVKDDAFVEDISKKQNFLKAWLEIQNDLKTAVNLDTTYVTSTNVPLNIAPDGNIDKRNSAMSSVADIQVLDILCGNVDRHPGNFMFQFEGEGKDLKLVGIKGIDNDMSLGLAGPGMDLGIKCLPAISNIGIISKEMADKMLLMTPDVLKANLRGYDLGNAEIDAAVERLNNLKEAIEAGKEHYKDKAKGELDEGFIREVDEKDFGEYSIKSLAKNGNYFENVKNVKTARNIERANEIRVISDSQKCVENEIAIFGEPINALDDNNGKTVEVKEREAGVDYNLEYDKAENHLAVEEMIGSKKKEPIENIVDINNKNQDAIPEKEQEIDQKKNDVIININEVDEVKIGAEKTVKTPRKNVKLKLGDYDVKEIDEYLQALRSTADQSRGTLRDSKYYN